MRLPILLLLTACSSYDLGMAKGEKSDDTGGAGAWDGDDVADTSADQGAEDSAPPEEENDFLRLAPAATEAYVFVANPTRNTVTRIAVPGLQVDTREVGEDPVVVATTSDYRHAATFNAGSDDVSIIDAETFSVTNVAVRDNFNTMSMSADGQWVMCWYDQDQDAVDTSGGVQSFNEVSFVNLATAQHFGMAVGFNPRGVRWTPDGRMALVVSDASLAIIDLTAESLAPTIVEIADDPLDAPPAEEVELTPNGRWAFVRQFGADQILLVDLEDLTYDGLPVGMNPTDLDLAPDGRMVAVVSRGAKELTVFDAEDPYADPVITALPADSEYGSVLFAGDGTQALLYTNASAVDRIGLWNTVDNVVTERSVVKPVQSVGVSPTGGTALIFHTETDAADADPTSPFYGEWALTLLDLSDYRQNPMLLPAEPTGYATSEDGRYGFFVMEGRQFLETLHFDTLLYEEHSLPSLPVYVGVLPGASLAYASQEHDLGRISFYDPDADVLDTVTGFELNSEIDHQED